MATRAFYEPLRSLAFGGISAAYATVGSPLENLVRAFCLTNNTDADMIFSLYDTIAEGQMILLAGSQKLYDVQANMNLDIDDRYVLGIGQQFYVKQVSAPTVGTVYVECMY